MARYDTTWQHRSKRKRAAQVKWMRVLAAPVAAVVAIFVAWVIVRSPLLKVRHVEVANASRVEPAAVMDAAKSMRTGFMRRMFTTAHLLGWPAHMPPEAVALVPGAKSIAIDRGFFSGRVTLEVTERDPVGIWCFEGDPVAPVCQWFDEFGVVYSRTMPGEGSLISVVRDRDQARAGEGRRVLPAERLENFLAILAILRERNISPRDMEVFSGDRAEVTMTTYNGPRMMFSLRDVPEHVSPVLDDFIKQGTLASQQYVDFRAGKRVFYQ